LTYHAVLHPDGSADVTTTATVTNTAPTHPASDLLGYPNGSTPVGNWEALVSTYLPSGATGVQSHTSGNGFINLNGHEFGHDVFTGYVGADSGQTTTLTVTYHVPEIVRKDGDVSTFSLQMLPQPTLYPEPRTMQVTLPSGASLTSKTGPLTMLGNTGTY